MAERETQGIAEAVEEVAGEKLGVEPWDRPAIFRESASAATDNTLPYWLVLTLSGAIATLGLALDSSAVVIGAMLVAPLLAPVVGLALSLAVGDGRLAVQTGTVVLASTVAVVLVAAVLTVLLPFQTITLEITARTRPTTLDLAIAIFSGLVGAVVTVARGSRLSAAIPGVAISVALIPPLAVAGFGMGAGWNAELIRGSLLLYGANLAGIVLSGMAVFLAVGMQRPRVLEVARLWHREEEPRGLAAWADRSRWVRSLGVFQSPKARVGMVLAFAIAVGVPLSESLSQIARESRVERAVSEAAEALFDTHDRASILTRQVVYGSGRTQVYLRVATTEWFGQEEREEFERRASASAREPVRLSLEQLPARGEDIEQLAALLPGRDGASGQPPPPPAPTGLSDLLASARVRLERAMEVIVLPEEMEVVGLELGTTQSGEASLRVAYAAPEPLSAQAEAMVRRQLTRALDLPELEVRLAFLSTGPRELDEAAGDTLDLGEVREILRMHDRLAAELLVPEGADPERVDRARLWLAEDGISAERIRVRPSGGSTLRVRLLPTDSPRPDD